MMCRLFLVALLGLAACAPSPLYVSSSAGRSARSGAEIPRDGQGEPIFSAIRQPLPSSLNSQPPVLPLYAAGTAVEAPAAIERAPLTKEERRACKRLRTCR